MDRVKQCYTCGELLPVSAFIRDKAKPDGLQYECRECRNARLRRYYSPERNRIAYLRQTYGLTPDDYQGLYDAQEGRCGVCGSFMELYSGNISKTAHVDHNHDTGNVRGLLCNGCNRGLGYFKDDTELLRAAIQYLGEAKDVSE